MAAMIRLVSASALRYFRSTGRPDPDADRRRVPERQHVRAAGRCGATPARCPTARRGSRAPSVIAASRAAPHRPLSTGSKNARPRGIVPCGMSATSSPRLERLGRGGERLVGAGARARRGCRPWPWRAGRRPARRRPPSCRGSAPAGRPGRRRSRPPARRSSCGGWRRGWPGPLAGCARRRRCRSGRTGTAAGRANGLQRPAAARCRRPSGTPAGTSRCMLRPAPQRGHDRQPGVGVHRDGVPDGATAAAGRRSCRSRPSSRSGRRRGRSPTSRTAASLPGAPHELAVDGAVVGAVALAVAGGDDVVEAEPSASGCTRSNGVVVASTTGPARLVVLVDERPGRTAARRRSAARPPRSPAALHRVAVPAVGHARA